VADRTEGTAWPPFETEFAHAWDTPGHTRYQLRDTKGISGGIYTQLTDIETEDNGLYTYDRAALKLGVGDVQAAVRGQ